MGCIEIFSNDAKNTNFSQQSCLLCSLHPLVLLEGEGGKCKPSSRDRMWHEKIQLFELCLCQGKGCALMCFIVFL